MNLIISQTILLIAIWSIIYILAFNNNNINNTLSPFECGYNSFFSNIPLSIQFTLLTFIFLLFDIELSILIASNWNITTINNNWISTISTFFILIIINIIYEISNNSLNWN